MFEIVLRAYPPDPHQNWSVEWCDVRVGTVEKISDRLYLVTGHPSKRNWHVALSFQAAKRWLDDHADEMVQAAV